MRFYIQNFLATPSASELGAGRVSDVTLRSDLPLTHASHVMNRHDQRIANPRPGLTFRASRVDEEKRPLALYWFVPVTWQQLNDEIHGSTLNYHVV